MVHETDIAVAGLSVHPALHRFVADELVPGIGMVADEVWEAFAVIIHDLAPRNRELLAERARLQAEIDQWHRAQPGAVDPRRYRAFLEDIGYIVPEGDAFSITTTCVDPEVSDIAGPQLVVPVSNARYALNAANARWGSLYDAVYGTDVLGSPPPPGPYDAERGARVIAWVRRFLDDVVPLRTGSHADVGTYRIVDGALVADGVALAEPSGLVGWQGAPEAPTSVLMRHHGLHIELRLDRDDPVGRTDRAGIADVVLEAAVTAIMDCEDSVAAVDAVDKVAVYRNWLGLMRGDLTAEVPGADGSVRERRLAPHRTFTTAGGTIELPGRALLLVRNVGLLMTTDAVRDRDGREVPEGFLDALVTVLAAVHDLHGPQPTNSTAGSVYVVKPKLHGPAEVAFADELFARVEALCGLAPNTVKLGLMDEERRTSVNLAECIRAIAHRIVFINTGFLDRTGDEIHTSMDAGPMVPKADMKHQPWLGAYEARNVATGLACGFRGRAQIGKGMWAAPDRMGAMVAEKIAHPDAGATCAWVPSPTAATLHATHYHRADVAARQDALAHEPPPGLEALLTIPLGDPGALTVEQRRREVEGNAQSILGYVVRWVDQGIGCSKVPDIDDVALMEDRATCRISSQHIANWLHHGVIPANEILDAMRRMAVVVDRQNEGDPGYRPMAPGYDGPAFRAACQLVLAGTEQPSGYTEPILHAHRRELTAAKEAAWTA